MYAKRIDANQNRIRKALEAIGCSVVSIGQPVDLLVGIAGLNILVECKDGDKFPSQQILTPAQEEFLRSWKGQVCIARSPEAAVAIVQAILDIAGRRK